MHALATVGTDQGGAGAFGVNLWTVDNSAFDLADTATILSNLTYVETTCHERRPREVRGRRAVSITPPAEIVWKIMRAVWNKDAREQSLASFSFASTFAPPDLVFLTGNPLAEVLSQFEIESLLTSMTASEEEPGSSAVTEQRRAAFSASAMAAPQIKAAEGHVFLPLHKRRRAAATKALASARPYSITTPPSYEPYDFRRPDKLSKDHVRSLQMLHENFASLFLSSLSAYLRAQAQVDLVSVEQVPYDEYLKSISTSLLNVLNADALGGQALLELDFGILFSMLDRLLGGKGAAGKVVRDLTDIEKVLSGNVVDLALTDLKTAWEAVVPVTFSLASMETSAQFVQIVPGNDTVVLMLFEIRIGDFQGAMSLCIPYLLIKPILNKLNTQRWFVSDRKKTSALHGSDLADRLNTTVVPCAARLGTASLTVADLVGLEVGQVIPMRVSPPANDPLGIQKGRLGTVDLVVGGQVKFRGRTGLRGRSLAVQIEQVVAPPLELIAHRDIG